jgi:AAHS family 3-hydroxyphenylpropionic acid transporter
MVAMRLPDVDTRLTIVLCVLGALCEGIDLQAAGVAAAGIASEYKPSAGELGSFFSASSVGLTLGAVLGGRLADSFGRKSVLVASIGLLGLFSLLTPLAWSMTTLVFARLLTGLGLGGSFPNLIALVAESSNEHRRNATVAMTYSAMPLGGALASLLSLLTPAVHWRLIFIAGGALPLLLVPIMASLMRESPAFRALRAQRSVSGHQGTTGTYRRSGYRAIFAEGRTAITLLLWVSFFLGLLTLYLLLNWLPTLLVGAGLTRMQAASAQISFNVGGAAAALLIGFLLESKRRGTSLIVTFLALPCLLWELARSPAQLPLILGAVFLVGCAVLAGQAFLYAAAPAAYPTPIRGLGVGAAIAAGRLGSIAGPSLGGLLTAAGHGSSQLLMDLLPLVVCGSASALALAWITRR